jgi:CheY-like chemotaxis protein
MGQNVLVVDDDENILRAMGGILRRGGYCPFAASNPLEALKWLRDFSGEIHLLLTDVMMAEIDGLTLAALVLDERPGIRVLLTSGSTCVPSRLPLLKKPFRMDQALKQVANVIAGPPPLRADVFASRESPPANARELVSVVGEARGRFLNSVRDFLDVLKDMPCGVPSPDGVARIELGGKARQAFEEYQRACKALDDHMGTREI